MGDDVLGNRPQVEAVAAPLRNRAQGLGQFRLTVDLAQARRAAAGQKDAPGRGVEAQDLRGVAPIERDPLGDRVAVPGEGDGRLKHFAQALGAVILQQGGPGIHGAGHGDRVGRLLADLGDALLREPAGIGGGRRPSGAVEGNHLAAALGREEHEAIAADAGRLRLDDALHGAGGDRRVHGVAAVLKYPQRRHRGERVRGGGHAVHRVDGRASWEFEISHA